MIAMKTIINCEGKMIVIDLMSPDGNAFAIMGICANVYEKLSEFKKALYPIENKTFSEITEEMTADGYENLLLVVEKYFGEFISLAGQR